MNMKNITKIRKNNDLIYALESDANGVRLDLLGKKSIWLEDSELIELVILP